MLSQISKLSIFLVAEPILNGSFGVYTGKETVDDSSVPHVEPSMKEQYFRAIVRLILSTTTRHTDLLCRGRHIQHLLSSVRMLILPASKYEMRPAFRLLPLRFQRFHLALICISVDKYYFTKLPFPYKTDDSQSHISKSAS